MNKSGAVFHWMVFGVLAALALFFVLTAQINSGLGVKGEWQLTFLRENVLKAEEQNVALGIMARNLGRETAETLAATGGFESHTSGCGTVDNVPLWNAAQQWCFPEAETTAISLVKERFAEPMLTLGIHHQIFWGTGEKKTITSMAGTYTYEPSFLVDLGYSFADYLVVEQQARQIVESCHNTRNIADCLASFSIAFSSWHYRTCVETETVPENNRILLFCVESPQHYLLNGGPVQYHLGLDLTPTAPFPVEQLSVTQKNKAMEISFKAESAQRYVVYITDYTALESQTGKAADLTNEIATGFLVRMDELRAEDLLKDPASCANKMVGKAYLCDNQIMYSVDLSAQPSKTGAYLFAVTQLQQGVESSISSWQKILVSEP